MRNVFRIAPVSTLIEMAIEPRSVSDRTKFDEALKRLLGDDPKLQIGIDSRSGQIILKGISEDHLDTKIEILRDAYNVDVILGAPQVSYREKLTKRVEIDYTHTRHSGGNDQFARVKIICEPNQTYGGNEFVSNAGDGAVPDEYIPGIEKGLLSVIGAGVLAGFPVADLKVTLIDGAHHEVDSSPLAFEIAARAALREAFQKGGTVLIEPIMKVEVVTPEDYVGSVIGDLNSRRGQILGQDMRGNAVVINAMVPLANMFGYVSNLRSFSQGRASYTMQFDRYGRVHSPNGDGPFRPAAAMRA